MARTVFVFMLLGTGSVPVTGAGFLVPEQQRVSYEQEGYGGS
ncbi:hypothetical protein PPTG_22464 [Phytophthora nicotianae INRA-310]|uniref:RxLR effector protein n=1 Tax=Phytophthora nicotianae (strain INRA-310) TaxID=761204 RepID=W2QG70_PHYN3|nr:hypothetical protein PPTG_22464 [Phytophthora nicotianae INRA-310]ETN12183.1 hypothetical protein PPTG_22464 [Phytophthora nicotianae INRA-310]